MVVRPSGANPGEAVRQDEYLHMDESYYTVLEKGGKSSTGKASCKVYIWAALASHLRLVHFFYENGSRARKVLTQYIKPDYQGAIQTDGLGDYKILETDEYPHAVRLACFQHCKRKFLDIKENKDAAEIIEIINKLYQKEHEMPAGYISLSRRNSLFCGSHQGAKKAALIYSLACSCRMNNINTFEYFKEILVSVSALLSFFPFVGQ